MIALRLVWQLAFLFFLLSAPGLAEAELETRVTLLFIDTPVDEALKAIGKEIGRKVYVARSVEGTVSLEFVNVPAREAGSSVTSKPLRPDSVTFLSCGAGSG